MSAGSKFVDDGIPVSDLEPRVELLVLALAQTPDLDGLITGLSGYEALLATVSPDHPASVDAVAVAGVWRGLVGVAREVRKLRQMRAAV